MNNYTKVSKLTYCCSDIQGLARRLVEAGFPGDHVFLIEDNAADMKYKPFKNNIEQQLDLVASLTRPGDMIVVAFSGHGVQLRKGKDDKEGVSYLCPADADLEKPTETLVPLDRVYKTLESCRARAATPVGRRLPQRPQSVRRKRHRRHRHGRQGIRPGA